MNESPKYCLPADGEHEPRAIFERLMGECDEFSELHAAEPHVEFLMRSDELVMQGRLILGTVYLPKVQGMLKDVFLWMLEERFGSVPDFLIILCAMHWEGATERQREVLMFHEMSHCGLKVNRDGEVMYDDDTGRARFSLIGHDVEEFSNVVRRYGAHSPDIQGFIAALQEHEARAQS